MNDSFGVRRVQRVCDLEFPASSSSFERQRLAVDVMLRSVSPSINSMAMNGRPSCSSMS